MFTVEWAERTPDRVLRVQPFVMWRLATPDIVPNLCRRFVVFRQQTSFAYETIS